MFMPEFRSGAFGVWRKFIGADFRYVGFDTADKAQEYIREHCDKDMVARLIPLYCE